ncbi:MAG: LysR family transcriptional regulator [Pseudomonadota bacterium]
MSDKTGAGIELSQLRLLQLIFETKNLTRAGERAGLTQSAVSHALKKLRHSFNDSLVIRQGNKLVLTPRAESLRGPLQRWLNDFERTILVQEQFEPHHSDHTFHVATSDLVEQVLAPSLIQHFGTIAPNVQLIFSKLNKLDLASQIDSGEVDFAISVMDSKHPSLMVTTLYRDDFVSATQSQHPYLASSGDIENFCYYPHLLVGTGHDKRGTLDDVLEENGFSRNIQFKVANFLSAPAIIEVSYLILTAPRKFMTAIADKFNITIFETPVTLPTYAMKLYWNVKNKDDIANRWMREQIIKVTRLE